MRRLFYISTHTRTSQTMQIPDPLIEVEIRKGYTVRLRRSQALKLGYIVDVKKVESPTTKKVRATKNKSIEVSE